MLCPRCSSWNMEHPGPILAELPQMTEHSWHSAGAQCPPIPTGNTEYPSPT